MKKMLKLKLFVFLSFGKIKFILIEGPPIISKHPSMQKKKIIHLPNLFQTKNEKEKIETWIGSIVVMLRKQRLLDTIYGFISPCTDHMTNGPSKTSDIQAHTLHNSFLSFFKKKIKNNEIIQTNFGRTVERELRSANCGTWVQRTESQNEKNAQIETICVSEFRLIKFRQ